MKSLQYSLLCVFAAAYCGLCLCYQAITFCHEALPVNTFYGDISSITYMVTHNSQTYFPLEGIEVKDTQSVLQNITEWPKLKWSFQVTHNINDKDLHSYLLELFRIQHGSTLPERLSYTKS